MQFEEIRRGRYVWRWIDAKLTLYQLYLPLRRRYRRILS